jgi:hypothetical protein
MLSVDGGPQKQVWSLGPHFPMLAGICVCVSVCVCVCVSE